jgi:hypothetical protein
MRIEYIEAITHIHLGFEMRRLEVTLPILSIFQKANCGLVLCRARFAGVKRNG